MSAYFKSKEFMHLDGLRVIETASLQTGKSYLFDTFVAAGFDVDFGLLRKGHASEHQSNSDKFACMIDVQAEDLPSPVRDVAFYIQGCKEDCKGGTCDKALARGFIRLDVNTAKTIKEKLPRGNWGLRKDLGGFNFRFENENFSSEDAYARGNFIFHFGPDAEKNAHILMNFLRFWREHFGIMPMPLVEKIFRLFSPYVVNYSFDKEMKSQLKNLLMTGFDDSNSKPDLKKALELVEQFGYPEYYLYLASFHEKRKEYDEMAQCARLALTRLQDPAFVLLRHSTPAHIVQELHRMCAANALRVDKSVQKNARPEGAKAAGGDNKDKKDQQDLKEGGDRQGGDRQSLEVKVQKDGKENKEGKDGKDAKDSKEVLDGAQSTSHVIGISAGFSNHAAFQAFSHALKMGKSEAEVKLRSEAFDQLRQQGFLEVDPSELKRCRIAFLKIDMDEGPFRFQSLVHGIETKLAFLNLVFASNVNGPKQDQRSLEELAELNRSVQNLNYHVPQNEDVSQQRSAWSGLNFRIETMLLVCCGDALGQHHALAQQTAALQAQAQALQAEVKRLQEENARLSQGKPQGQLQQSQQGNGNGKVVGFSQQMQQVQQRQQVGESPKAVGFAAGNDQIGERAEGEPGELEEPGQKALSPKSRVSGAAH